MANITHHPDHGGKKWKGRGREGKEKKMPTTREERETENILGVKSSEEKNKAEMKSNCAKMSETPGLLRYLCHFTKSSLAAVEPGKSLVPTAYLSWRDFFFLSFLFVFFLFFLWSFPPSLELPRQLAID